MFNYYRRNKRKDINKRAKILMCLLIGLLGLLILRVNIVQNDDRNRPEVHASTSSNHIQKENNADYAYGLLDINGEMLFNTYTKYVLVIDTLAFNLNIQNQNSEQLIAFNVLMQSVDSEFSFDKVMRHKGKLYYFISEDNYNVFISELTDVRGVYAYPYEAKSNQQYWRIENMIQSTTNNIGGEVVDKSDNSLEMQIKREVGINEIPKIIFQKDINGKYDDGIIQKNNDNLDVRLTLDKDMQEMVRSILNDEKYSEYPNIGAIIIEANTGRILSLAQKDETQANLVTAAGGIKGYDPGSVFKILTLEAAMEYHNVKLSDKIACTGIKCKPEKIHGTITVGDAFKVSCNDVFVKLGQMVTKDELENFIKKQGLLTSILGLDSHVEAVGNIDTKPDALANISIGQTIYTSLLQMTGTITTILNEGTYIKPYIVESLDNQEGKTVRVLKTYKERVVSKDVADSLKQVMNSTVRNGTAVVANIPGIEVGAKTGTAQDTNNNKNQWHGWFIGYFKYNNKYYALGVMVPNIGEKNSNDEVTVGGNTAGPIFRDIILNITNNLK